MRKPLDQEDLLKYSNPGWKQGVRELLFSKEYLARFVRYSCAFNLGLCLYLLRDAHLPLWVHAFWVVLGTVLLTFFSLLVLSAGFTNLWRRQSNDSHNHRPEDTEATRWQVLPDTVLCAAIVWVAFYAADFLGLIFIPHFH